jgi:hypothetical protein
VSEWSRPASGFRFKSGGIKINTPADALGPDKYPYLQNVRSYEDDSLQTRPQISLISSSVASTTSVLSLEGSLGFYKSGTGIFSTGSSSGPIDTGYSTGGVSMTPFRPNSSSNAWEYIWDSVQSRKANINSGTVTVQNTGIVEPQAPVDFGIGQSFFTPLSVTNTQTVNFVTTGSVGFNSITTRVADTVAAVFQDPALPPGTLPEYTLQTTAASSATAQYQTGMVITVGTPGPDTYFQVKDVYPALVGTTTIAGIYYYAGTTGRCVVVPQNIGADDNEGLSLLQQNILAGIRRGALVTIGTETCYVLGTAAGVDGTISFEVITTAHHAAGEILTGKTAIKVLRSSQFAGGSPGAPTAGQAIGALAIFFTTTSGLGTTTSPVGTAQPFSYAGTSYRPDDYVHFSLAVDDYSKINEIKLLFDVSDGTFTADYYFYSFRPNDIMAGIQNNLTQLGVAQLSAQRTTIDDEAAVRGSTSSSAEFLPGAGQWSDLYIPLSQFIRVGGDQTRSFVDVNSFQMFCNASGNTDLFFGTVDLCGGFSPDTEGNPAYQYFIRPRSSLTGAQGNPSPLPRYGIRPKREEILVILPTTYVDTQMDYWDIFRFGGTADTPRFAGTVPLSAGQFLDQFSDLALANNPVLSYDNKQPFPSIGPPLMGTASVVGTAMVATLPTASAQPSSAGTLNQIANLLPGNLINVTQQVYTLWTRPTLISSTGTTQTWLLQTVENAGVLGGAAITINEPLLAAQHLPFVWGPDANGVMFAVGDPLRPGFIVTTNAQNPDSASDKNSYELCQPTEPLLNGFLLAGTSIVFSTNRAWRGYPLGTGRYNWVEIPVGKGLAAPFALTTDGKIGHYVGKDGIYEMDGGPGRSITDEDLYTLFPNEGTGQGVNYVYGSLTVFAPDYTRADRFRLANINGFLFFEYLDLTGTQRTMVYQLSKKAWSIDVTTPSISVRSGTTAPAESAGVLNNQMFMGAADGSIYMQLATPTTSGETINCFVAIKEEMYGDIRASKLFGDASFDAIIPDGMTIQPVQFGAIASSPTTLIPATVRPQIPFLVDLGGEIRARALGAILSWTDRGFTTFLYSFQYSYIEQPADTADRFGDWDDSNYLGNKYYQGFILECDTSNANKVVLIRDSDLQQLHDFDSVQGANTINHNGQIITAYSFTNPFIAHSVRYEPDGIDWRMFKLTWVFQPTPESVFTWKTQPTSHGQSGWQHLRQNQIIAHRSTADITFTLLADGTTYTFTIPNSGGFFAKTILPISAIKAMVWEYTFTSTQPFSLWQEDQEHVMVKAWGSTGPYERFKLMGGQMGPRAEI